MGVIETSREPFQIPEMDPESKTNLRIDQNIELTAQPVKFRMVCTRSKFAVDGITYECHKLQFSAALVAFLPVQILSHAGP